MSINTNSLFFGCPPKQPYSDTVVRFAKSTKHFTPKHKTIEYSYDGICLQGVDWDESLPAMEFKLNWQRIREGWAGSGSKTLSNAYSKQLIQKYWSLLAKHKGLPKDAIYLKSGNWIRLRDVFKYPPSLVYAYLCHWRHAWEEPAHIYNVMELTKQGMDLWLAYLVSTAISINNEGHNILPLSASDNWTAKGDTGVFLNRSININMARKLHTYFSNPDKYDHRKIETYGGWNMHSTLREVSVLSVSKGVWPIRDILARPANFSKAVKAKTKEAAENALGSTTTTASKQAKTLRDLGYKTLTGYIKGEFRLNARKDPLKKFWVVVPMVKSKATANKIVAAVKPFITDYECKKDSWGYTLHLRRKTKTYKKG